MKTSVSLHDIARRLRISTTSVSNVLNRTGYTHHVSPRKARRIQQVARELGYAPNHAAKSLKLGRTNTIALFFSSRLRYPYMSELVERIQAALLAHQYHLSLELFPSEPPPEVYYAGAARCDGLIRFGISPVEARHLRIIRKRGTPVVIVYANAGRQLDSVALDDVEATRVGVAHLVERGSRHIALVQGIAEDPENSVRVQGYRQALETAGISFDPRLIIPWEVDRDIALLWRRISELRPLPDAIFTFNEEPAIELLRLIRLAGWRVPGDIAMATQGNTYQLKFADVSLTAVDTNPQAMAQLAVERLLEQIRNPRAPARHIQVQPKLIVRASTIVQPALDGEHHA